MDKKMILEFDVVKQCLIRRDSNKPVEGSENYLYAKFKFSSDYEGLNIKAKFENNGVIMEEDLNEDNMCIVPAGTIHPSLLSVSILGYSTYEKDDEGKPIVKITTNIENIRIYETIGNANSNSNVNVKSNAIIDVEELPTENIEKNIIYRVVDKGADYYLLLTDPNGQEKVPSSDVGEVMSMNIIIVETLPETGYPCYDLAQTSGYPINLYFEKISQTLNIYVDEAVLSMGIGTEVGWTDANVLFTMMSMPFAGVFEKESDIPEQSSEEWMAYIIVNGYKYYVYDNEWVELITSKNVEEKVNANHLYEHYMSWHSDGAEFFIDFTYLSNERRASGFSYTFLNSLIEKGEHVHFVASGWYYEGLVNTGEKIQVTEIVMMDNTIKVHLTNGDYYDLYKAANDNSLDHGVHTYSSRQIF